MIQNMLYDHPISYMEKALVGAIGVSGRLLRTHWVSRCAILGLERRWWGRRWRRMEKSDETYDWMGS